MKLFDSHAHYCDKQFENDRDAALARAFEAGVCGILTLPSTVEEAFLSQKIAHAHEGVYFAAGVHPEECGKGDLSAALSEIAALARDEKCVCIGETGLDYHWEENPPRETQKAWFSAQCALAKDLNLPVSVHDRDAHGDTLEILKKFRPKGVLHCYSGSPETAEEYVKMGFYLSFGGVITFPKSEKAKAALLRVPDGRLLIETDCPYLAPVPFRGKRNESAYVAHTLCKIAEIRGQNPETLADITAENARRLFMIGG